MYKRECRCSAGWSWCHGHGCQEEDKGDECTACLVLTGAHVSASAGTDSDGFLGEAQCAQAQPFTVCSAPVPRSLHHWRLSTACEMSRYGTVPADTPANGSIGPVPCSANSQPSVLPIAASISSDDVRSYLQCPKWARSFSPSFSTLKTGPPC